MNAATPPVDVLVVGAGPTGLTTALQAHLHGATVRVVDRRPEPRRPSRAMIVHPPTLEALLRLGVSEELLARGDRAPRAELHLGGRPVGVRLAEVPLDDTPFPHLTMVRQQDVEDVLTAALRDRGVEVERGVELRHAWAAETGARAALRHPGGEEETRSRFLVGCDGPDSAVRRAAGIGWHGGTYREEVVLADAELDGDLAPGALHVFAGRPGLVFVFALGEGATWRVLATRPAGTDNAGAPFGQPGREVPRHELDALLDGAGLDVRVTDLRWSARVRLQHRVAERFRRGRLFLAGDAAHAHSPAAAQGMNTGIADAANLGWKLALAAGVAGDVEPLLDSYELERRPVARQVLALTHAVFFAEASTHPLPALLRGRLVPLAAPAAPWVTAQPVLMAQVVRLLSQRWVRYRRSPLSVDQARCRRGPRPGDRLPDGDVLVDGARRRLHDVTAGPGVHLLLDRDAPDVTTWALGPWVTVHRLDSRRGTGLVAVRPDGRIGFRAALPTPAGLGGWLELLAAR